jgi:hypothetical protein
MSNYTIAVAWSGKDALSDSDAAKVISGADFNTEFTAVQTAVNTKSDLNGSATESFSATTAAAGTNTTQVATTAFVETATSAANIADAVYPVGAIFTTVTAYADSAAVVTAIGGNTWTVFGAGKVLVGLDSSDTDFDTIEETGGSKTDSHTLTIAEMPAHTHTTVNSNSDSGAGKPATGGDATEGSGVHTSDSTGGGGSHTHDIVQPYITVYMWKRIA